MLLVISVQDLRSTSQDTSTSAFYLANIYQILADPNVMVPCTFDPPTAAIPATFSPPRYAIWVNSLWFMSLVISLSCGLFTTLLQQWACRYVVITQPAWCHPEERARMRAFFANGINMMRVPILVEALPTMLHLSLCLFFSGLVIFLVSINLSVSFLVLSLIMIYLTTYGGFTVMPIFLPNNPCHTPLSSLTWLGYTYIRHTLLTGVVYIAQ